MRVLSAGLHSFTRDSSVETLIIEVPRDWKNWFVKSRVRYFEVRVSYLLE